MTVALVEGGEIKQVWRDVKTPADLKKKYGLFGAGYRAVPNAVVGQVDVNRKFENPVVPRVPQPKPDLAAAIQALIAGDTVAAQAAMDRKK